MSELAQFFSDQTLSQVIQFKAKQCLPTTYKCMYLFHLNQFGHFKDHEILLKDNFAHTLLTLSTLSEYQMVVNE